MDSFNMVQTIDMIFSLRQLQEKCREQHMPLYIAFIDLTKAFDLVSRDGFFNVLPKIGCPPKLQSMIESFHTDTKGTVQVNAASRRHSKSAVASDKAASLLQCSLGLSLACC